MPHNYSTAASHVILAGTGIYCIVRYTTFVSDIDLPLVTFGVIIVHSLFGVWKWGNPDHGDKVQKPFDVTLALRDALALSCITGQMAMKAGFDRMQGYAHPFVSSIPLLLSYLIDEEIKDEVLDKFAAMNIICCAVYSYTNSENWWGVAAAVSYVFSRIRLQDYDIPAEDLHNFALCFFTYFAYRACVGVLATF